MAPSVAEMAVSNLAKLSSPPLTAMAIPPAAATPISPMFFPNDRRPSPARLPTLPMVPSSLPIDALAVLTPWLKPFASSVSDATSLAVSAAAMTGPHLVNLPVLLGVSLAD